MRRATATQPHDAMASVSRFHGELVTTCVAEPVPQPYTDAESTTQASHAAAALEAPLG